MPESLQSLKSRFTELFLGQVDARIYACVRIAFAIVSLLNLLQLWPDREIFFTDAGMIDQAIVQKYTLGFYLSVFDVCRDVTAVSTYMILNGCAMILLTLGVRPRLMACTVYVWYVSYAARAPLALAGWDHVLRSLSFLVLVSPMPACWSLTFGKARKAVLTELRVPCYGLTLMRLQVVAIYWQSVLGRLDSPFWLKGEFMGFFLLSHNSRWPGLWVVEYGFLLKIVTYLVLITEIMIPVLLIVPRWRWFGFITGFLLHAGIHATAHHLGLFFLAMMTLYLSFLRDQDIEWLSRRLPFKKAARVKR